MSAMDMFWAAPPISRTLAASAFLLSLAFYTGMVSGYYLIWHTSFLLRKFPPQIWRLVTSFLITGKDLSIIFDTYFLYTYGSKLESASPRFSQPGDFMTYILFVCFTILGLNILLDFFFVGGVIFTSCLVLAFAYTSAQDDRGMRANFFIITIPAQWVPYAMLLMTLVTAGPTATMIQATGLIAAHLHDFLTRLWPEFGGGTNLVPTPTFIRNIFAKPHATVKHKAYGTAFAQPEREGSGSDGVLPESWRNRGSGHRLGGN